MRRAPGALEREVVATIAAADDGMTTPEIHSALDSALAYTTVMTTLSRLCEKGVLVRSRVGRAYRYWLAESVETMEEALTAHQMRRLLDTQVDRTAVMSRFVGDLDAADARLLADLVAEAHRGQGRRR